MSGGSGSTRGGGWGPSAECAAPCRSSGAGKFVLGRTLACFSERACFQFKLELGPPTCAALVYLFRSTHLFLSRVEGATHSKIYL